MAEKADAAVVELSATPEKTATGQKAAANASEPSVAEAESNDGAAEEATHEAEADAGTNAAQGGAPEGEAGTAATEAGCNSGRRSRRRKSFSWGKKYAHTRPSQTRRMPCQA